jgi:hypothetical protein
MSNTINVTACDNELVIIAYNWDNSYELCRILSGNNQSVNVTLNIQPGTYEGPIVLNGVNQPLNVTVAPTIPPTSADPTHPYSLLMLGVDWGGPAQFTTTVNSTSYNLPLQPTGAGLVFNPGPIAITV